jgi:hypothetical protein
MVSYASVRCRKCNMVLKAKNYVKLSRLLEVHNKMHEEEQQEEEKEEK